MAVPGGLEHEELFKDVTEMVREYLLKYGQRSSKVRSLSTMNSLVCIHMYICNPLTLCTCKVGKVIPFVCIIHVF